MSSHELLIQRLKDKVGYTATEAEAVEIIDLLAIVDAAPRVTTVLGDEPATIFVPPLDRDAGSDGDE